MVIVAVIFGVIHALFIAVYSAFKYDDPESRFGVILGSIFGLLIVYLIFSIFDPVSASLMFAFAAASMVTMCSFNPQKLLFNKISDT